MTIWAACAALAWATLTAVVGGRNVAPRRPWLTGVVAVLAGCAWIHLQHPAGHRLFFDEDAYANIALNIVRGYGPTLTASWLESGKEVEPYKWPAGFPSLAAPFVAALGPEQGPRVLNELCGAVTLAILIGLGARLSGDLLGGIAAAVVYAFHPVVGGWYRAGSAEPLAIALLALTLWAVVECRRAATGPRGSAVERWGTVGLLAALVACHVRLEGVLVALPVCALLPGWRRIAPTAARRAAIALLALALLAAFGAHARSLPDFYLVGAPDASFSLRRMTDNLRVNAAFLWQHTPWPVLVMAAAAGVRAARDRSGWAAWGGLVFSAVASFGVLLFYSVGQYTAPGGSRFVLAPVMALALLAGAGLSAFVAGRYRSPLVAAGAIVFVASLAHPEAAWREISAAIRPAALEHDAIQRWAVELSPAAVVVTPVPYLWEDAGVYAAAPAHAAKLGIDRDGTRSVFVHRGVFAGRADPLLVRLAEANGHAESRRGDDHAGQVAAGP